MKENIKIILDLALLILILWGFVQAFAWFGSVTNHQSNMYNYPYYQKNNDVETMEMPYDNEYDTNY